MKIKSGFLLSLLVLTGCRLFNTPDLNISGITETDASGNFIGEIDQRDWSSSVYDDIYFGPNIWITPRNELLFKEDSVGKSLSKSITVFNFSTETLPLGTTISGPFTCLPAEMTITGKSLSTFIISTMATDTLSKSGLLTISGSKGDGLTISIRSEFQAQGVEPISTVSNTLFPAYPNPASGSISIKYSLEKSAQVSLYVRDESNLIVIRLLNNVTQPAGAHSVLWNLRNEGVSAGFYRVFLKTDSFSAKGDIKIEE